MKRADAAWVLLTSLWAAAPLTAGALSWALVVRHADPGLTFGALPLSIAQADGIAWGWPLLASLWLWFTVRPGVGRAMQRIIRRDNVLPLFVRSSRYLSAALGASHSKWWPSLGRYMGLFLPVILHFICTVLVFAWPMAALVSGDLVPSTGAPFEMLVGSAYPTLAQWAGYCIVAELFFVSAFSFPAQGHAARHTIREMSIGAPTSDNPRVLEVRRSYEEDVRAQMSRLERRLRIDARRSTADPRIGSLSEVEGRR